MAKKVSRKAQVSGTIASFEMNLKGGALPDGFEAKLRVEMDFEGVSKEKLFEICASGQSTRVTLQSQLRKKSTSELTKLAEEGLKVRVQDIYSGQGLVKPIDRLLALNREDFVLTMVRDLGLDEEMAHETFNRKHGLEVGSRGEK